MKIFDTKRLALVVSLAAALYVGLLIYFDIGKIAYAVSNFNASYALAVFFSMLASQVFMFARWNYLLSLSGIRIGLKKSILIYFSSWGVFFFPAKTGEMIKCFFLKKLADAPYKVSAPVVIMEQAADLITVLGLCLIGIYLIGLFSNAIIFILMILMLALIGVLLPLNKQVMSLLISIISRMPFLKRFSGEAGEMLDRLRLLLRPQKLAAVLALSLGYWLCSSAVLYFTLKGLASPLSFLASAFAFPFSIIIGILSAMPGGIGIMEGSLMVILVMQDVVKTSAAAAIVILRVFTLWIPAVFGIFALFNINRRMKAREKKKDLVRGDDKR